MKGICKLFAVIGITVASVQNVAAQDSKAIPLKLAVYPGALISVPEYVGADQGIYARNGIDAKIVPIPTGPDQIAAAASGSVDIIGMTISLGLLANAQGQDLIILTNNIRLPLFTWLKQKDFSMPHLKDGYPASMKDLKGVRVGVPARGSEVELFTRLLLADGGLDPTKDVVYVPVGFGATALAAFEAKQVDVLGTIEPVQTMLTSKGAADVVLDLQTGKDGPEVVRNFPGNSRMSVRSLAQDKPEAVKRYIKAQTEIVQFISDPKNEDAVVASFTKASGLPADLAKKIIEIRRSLFTVEFNCESYANVLSYLQRSGQMTAEKAKSGQSCESFIAPQAKSLLKG